MYEITLNCYQFLFSNSRFILYNLYDLFLSLFHMSKFYNLISTIVFKAVRFSILPCRYFSLATILREKGAIREAFLEEMTFFQSSEYLVRIS